MTQAIRSIILDFASSSKLLVISNFTRTSLCCGFIIAETFRIRLKSEVMTVMGNYGCSFGGYTRAPLCFYVLSPYD